MTTRLPPLKVFILPSGGVAAVQLHVARTVCRRAERQIVAVNEEEAVKECDAAESPAVEPSALKFINRLSDYLFTAARFTAEAFGVPIEHYRKLER